MSEQRIVTENRHFGRYLRRIRRDRKLSLDAVEEMTLSFPEPLTKSHLSRIENGRAVPTFPRLFALCQIYGVPIASMAERFETDLRRDGESSSVDGLTDNEIFERLIELRNTGRYDLAVGTTTSMMERVRENDPGFAEEFSRRIAEWHVNCLVHLGRFETAKIQCEDLLGVFPADTEHHLNILLSFIRCSYRLKRYAVTMMGLDRIDTILSESEWKPRTLGVVETVRGPALFTMGAYDRARRSFENTIRIFVELQDEFETCRARINLGLTLAELGKYGAAARHLTASIETAVTLGYERLQALGLSHMSMVSYRQGELDAAEKYACRSNTIARPRDFVSLVFRNSFYLWRCAGQKQDSAAAALNEKTLKALMNRMRESPPEAEEYRRLVEGGVQ